MRFDLLNRNREHLSSHVTSNDYLYDLNPRSSQLAATKIRRTHALTFTARDGLGFVLGQIFIPRNHYLFPQTKRIYGKRWRHILPKPIAGAFGGKWVEKERQKREKETQCEIQVPFPRYVTDSHQKKTTDKELPLFLNGKVMLKEEKVLMNGACGHQTIYYEAEMMRINKSGDRTILE